MGTPCVGEGAAAGELGLSPAADANLPGTSGRFLPDTSLSREKLRAPPACLPPGPPPREHGRRDCLENSTLEHPPGGGGK